MTRGNFAFIWVLFSLACGDPTAVEVFHSQQTMTTGPSSFPSVPEYCAFPSKVPDPIVVMATPSTNPEQAQRLYAPMLERLARKTGLRFVLNVPATYADLEKSLLSGAAHLAIASPLNYVQVKLKDPCAQLLLTAVSAGFAHYSSYFLVRTDATFTDIQDFRGARLALLGPESASGSLSPLEYFRAHDIDPNTFFGSIVHFPNHLAALHALQDGQVDLVPTFSGIFAPARRDGVQMTLFRVFSVLERIPNDALVASASLPRDVAIDVGIALYELNSDSSYVSRGVGNDNDLNGWIYTRDSLYNPLRVLLGEEALP